jgi:hypothetical protein
VLHGLSALIRELKQNPPKQLATYAFDFISYRSQKFEAQLQRTGKNQTLNCEIKHILVAIVKTQSFSGRRRR